MSKINILCVEDGSVYIDSLEQECLTPGKVLVYRQGSKPPFTLEVDVPDYKKMWNMLYDALTVRGGLIPYYQVCDIMRDIENNVKKEFEKC